MIVVKTTLAALAGLAVVLGASLVVSPAQAGYPRPTSSPSAWNTATAPAQHTSPSPAYAPRPSSTGNRATLGSSPAQHTTPSPAPSAAPAGCH